MQNTTNENKTSKSITSKKIAEQNCTQLDVLIAASMPELIAYFASHSYLAPMASVCIDKEKGLRKQASATILSFIDSTQQLPMATQCDIAVELCELFCFTHFQTLTTPLMRYFVAVMQDWAAAEPNNDVPLIWLSFLTYDGDYALQAYAQNPKNAFALCHVVNVHLTNLDNQTHHSHAIKSSGDCANLKQILDTTKNLLGKLKQLIDANNVQYAHYITKTYSQYMSEYAEYLAIYYQWLKN